MQLGFGNPRVLLASGVVGRERRFWFLDDLRRNWEQEGVMFTPQGKGWTGWSTPTAANQRSGGGAPAASAPLGKGKEGSPSSSRRFCSIITFFSSHSSSV